jgi:hypothetical protein
MTKTKRENLVYIFIALGSVLFLLWLIPEYTPAYPGYGVPGSLVPNVVVGTILVLSVLGLILNLIKKPTIIDGSQSDQVPQQDKVHLLHLVRFMLPCILLMPAMQWIGFIPAGILFLIIIQLLCGQRKPVKTALVAIIPVFILYLAMRYGLSVPMP